MHVDSMHLDQDGIIGYLRETTSLQVGNQCGLVDVGH